LIDRQLPASGGEYPGGWGYFAVTAETDTVGTTSRVRLKERLLASSSSKYQRSRNSAPDPPVLQTKHRT